MDGAAADSWCARRVLEALGRGPASGYELARRLASTAEGPAPIGEGGIYPLLHGLTAEGRVVAEPGSGAARVYRLAGAADGAADSPPLVRLRWSALLAALWWAEAVWFLLRPAAAPVSDAASYWRAGADLLRTGRLGTYWPPLYPLVTAVFHLVGGVPALLAVQTALVAATVAAVAAWLRRASGETAAAVFLAAMVLFPVLYLDARFVMSDSLFACGVMVWWILTEQALAGGGPGPDATRALPSRSPLPRPGGRVHGVRPRGKPAEDCEGQSARGTEPGDWRLMLRCGLVLAALAALRPTALPICAATSLWLWRSRGRRAAAAMALPAAAQTLLWGLYNRTFNGVWIFTQQNFWVNLWVGNNARAFGMMVYPLEPAGAPPSTYRALALAFIVHHPLRFLGLCLARLALFWLLPVDYLDVLAVRQGVVPQLWLGWVVVATLAGAAAALWAALRLARARDLSRQGVALSAIAAMWLFVLPFFVQARFRLAALPLSAGLMGRAAARRDPDGEVLR